MSEHNGRSILTMGRFSLSFLQNLVWAGMALGVAAPVPAWSQNTFGGTGTVFVSYANAATNPNLAASPSVNVGFNSSGRYTPFTMDTGSVGIVATRDAFQPAPRGAEPRSRAAILQQQRQHRERHLVVEQGKHLRRQR